VRKHGYKKEPKKSAVYEIIFLKRQTVKLSSESTEGRKLAYHKSDEWWLLVYRPRPANVAM